MKKEEEIIYLSVGIPIDKQFVTTLVDLNQRIRDKFGSRWIIDEVDYPAHITLWLAYIPKKNLLKSLGKIRSIIKSFSTLSIKSMKISIENADEEYAIKLPITYTEQLRTLHYRLLDSLNVYRDGYIHTKYINMIQQKSVDEEVCKNIKKYGTRFVADLFYPHITIAFVEKNKCSKKEILNLCSDIGCRFETDHIVVLAQESQGSPVDVIERIYF